MIEHVFVYGMLRPPKADVLQADTLYYSQIAEYVQEQRPATLPNALLYDLGEYPGARPLADDETELTTSIIYGELLTLAPEAIPIIDEIEGYPNLYNREQVLVDIADESILAWVYWVSPSHMEGRPIIPSGDWFERPDAELRSHIERFSQVDCSWLSTVRPDGRAHLSPMWHVWYRGRAFINTPDASVKVANIKKNPNVSISHPDPSNVILIEGTAAEANHLQEVLKPLFKAKYDWDITTDNEYNTVIEIIPTKLMTWSNSPVKRWHQEEILQVW